MFKKFRTILIGGENAKRAAFKIAEFDYLAKIPFSVSSFVNANANEKFSLVNYGFQWHDLPVFKNIDEAIKFDEIVDSVVICVNAKYILEWVKKVLIYKSIKNITILAEDVPEKDAMEIVFLAESNGVNIIGPSSTGMIVAGKGRLGEIGGDWKNLNLCHLDKPGSVGLITKSGGMSGEFMWVISQNSPGISAAIQIGGDAFPATDFTYWLEKFSHNSDTKIVVMAGEAGGDLEERAAEWYEKYVAGSQFTVHSRTKSLQTTANCEHDSIVNLPFKLIAVISGKFLEQMPKGQKFGHAGAKQEESGFGSAKNKIEILKNSGIEVVEFEQLSSRLKEISETVSG